jgi:REP element-mobilizing transposase RayT
VDTDELSSYKTNMARARKRHIQQNLAFPNRAGNLRGVKREPGKRRRRSKTADGQPRRPVGRPKKNARASERHKVRPTLGRNEPVHVTLRVTDDVGRLRKRDIYMAVREALITVLPHESCRIVHLSIQGNHLHLLVEAENRMALARGMQAFEISAAKHINAACAKAGSWWERRNGGGKRRKGSVFPDRYHAEIITTPRQARHALSYVLPRKPWAYLRRFERDFIAERLQFLEQLLRVGRCSSLQKVLRSEVYKGLVAREHVIRGDQELVCDGHERPQRAAACA